MTEEFLNDRNETPAWTETEYLIFRNLLDGLIDEVGEDELHPLASLMEVVGVLIEKYEDDHVPILTEE